MVREVPEKLLAILACPKCNSELKYEKAKSRLVCKSAKCGKIYSVENGIPVMTP